VQADVDISLEEAFAGTRKTFSMELDEPCATCQGSGNVGGKPCASCQGTGWQRARREVDVRIPPGVRTGQKVRVSGEGGGGSGGRGDLYLVVSVAPHPLFERRGDDLTYTLPITAPEAALGATIEVPTLRGKVSMKVFRLRGYGMPKLKGGGAGDELVTVKIAMPTELTAAERELYERLRALRTDSPRGYTQG
jgi:molecular chaperone DnaJ